MTFLLGVVMAYGHTMEALAVGVLVTVLLSLKEEFHWFVSQITQTELLAFIKFAVLGLLVLPLLPDAAFGPGDIMNYREVGWIVVLTSSISFAGYLALKFSGPEKGLVLTALLGGLLSSTMIAWVFAQRSRQTPELSRQLGAGILLASTVMYARMILLVGIFNSGMLGAIGLPGAILLVLSLIIVWRILRSNRDKVSLDKIPLGNPLDIRNAVLFAALFMGVALLLYYSRVWLGATGAFLSAALSGVADMDAITINSAKWASSESDYTQAVRLILIAMLSNTLFKLAISLFQGNKAMRKYVLMGFGAVLVVGTILLSIV